MSLTNKNVDDNNLEKEFVFHFIFSFFFMQYRTNANIAFAEIYLHRAGLSITFYVFLFIFCLTTNIFMFFTHDVKFKYIS